RSAFAAPAARRSTSRRPTTRRLPAAESGAEQREQAAAVAAVGGRSIAVDGRDPNERRVAHRRRGEISKRVAVGPFALYSSESEALGGQAAPELVGFRAPGAAQLL